jgi:hypothetical protein
MRILKSKLQKTHQSWCASTQLFLADVLSGWSLQFFCLKLVQLASGKGEKMKICEDIAVWIHKVLSAVKSSICDQAYFHPPENVRDNYVVQNLYMLE